MNREVRMSGQPSRRRFLRVGAAFAAGTSLARRVGEAGAAEPDRAPELTVDQDGPLIWIRLGDRVLTCYRAHPTQKYPYFYPLAGPLTGLSLTAESGRPWPHHRSLFFGCDRVNGANFWQGPPDAGQIVSTGPRLGPTTAGSAQVLDRCEWRRPGYLPVLRDERQFTVTVVSPKLLHLDAWIKLTAVPPVHVEQSNHSLFAVRAAADLAPAGGGRLVNSEGQAGEAGTFGQKAGWCDFSGRRAVAGEGAVEGIALLDHPANPWSPCLWFTRGYGFMSPTPFIWLGADGWRLSAGQSVTLRYRVVCHAGDAAGAGLADIHKSWAAAKP
jgi:hypothetical protein